MQGRRNVAKSSYIDVGLLFSTFVLIIIGLIMIYSTSAYEAKVEIGDSFFYFKKQLFATALGIVALIFTAKFDYRRYKSMGRLALIVAGVSMFLILTPLAYSANGATRWVKILGISIQPAEIVKIAIIIFLSGFITRRISIMDSNKWTPAATAVAPAIFSFLILIMTSNLSSAIIVMGIAFVMLYCVTKSPKQYLILAGIVLVFATLFVLAVANEDKLGWDFGYRGDRVRAWLNPEGYDSDEGYQTLQSLYAIGSGGIMGKGIGESVQKLGFIPEAQNDMIFSIICEELGLAGAIFVMALFFVLIWRCMYIAINSRDLFGKLLVIGVMAHFAIQVILNIAVVTNSIPNTGISLPFISYGGTSIVFLMAEIGIVINVGKKIDV
ncbi:MAG TPA: cell division protein [Lachnospiraceae bacterium]|nr:cell division protein [Lachnospiraceae bacterium]